MMIRIHLNPPNQNDNQRPQRTLHATSRKFNCLRFASGLKYVFETVVPLIVTVETG